MEFLSNSDNERVLDEVFGLVTPMNDGKWDRTEPSRDSYNFDKLDQVVVWARSHGHLIRGHSPVWDQNLPSWVNAITDRNTLTAVLWNHVFTHVGRYKGMIYAWDVVNEAFEYGGFQNNVFYRVMGDDYIRVAFAAARAADPDAKLYINDHNTIETGSNSKTAFMIDHVKKLIQDGVPIDGIGAEAHVSTSYLSGTESHAADAFRELCAAAPECAITELDVKGGGTALWTTLTQACLEISNCVGVSVWGVADHQSWQKAAKPLLFDDDYEPKEAFYAVEETIQSYLRSKRT